MKISKKIKIANSIRILILFVVFSFGFSNTRILKSKMSTTILKFIPTAPVFIPTPINQDKVKAYLKSIFKNTEVKLVQTENIEFVDPGANFETITCDLCGRNINNDVWQHAMDKAYKNHFTDLSFTTPCCDKQTTLNDLKYQWPAGFAKFVIIIYDPIGDIKPNEFTELEKLLGTKIRKVWAHY